MNNTLLDYKLSPNATAFSTTRVSPHPLSSERIKEMGNYAAFNVTHYCGDDPERVQENKQWLCDTLHIQLNQLWLPRQTHTANVQRIDTSFLSKSATEQVTLLQDIDALITNLPQQCIGISTADCVPILIFDEVHHAIAAIHAGWRGTVSRIAQHAIQQMTLQYNTSPQHCKAIIGPSISVEAFEVGEEVVQQFLQAGFPQSIISRSPRYATPRPHIDLWAANSWLLEGTGIPLSNIQIAGICTFSHADTFFSARKLGINSGRIFTGIMLNQP